MDQTSSHEVVVKNSAKAVIVPLKDCIWSLNSVYEALVAAEVHPVTGHCSNYDYIRQQIEQAWCSLQQSDQAATACLRHRDEHLETLIQDEGTFDRQMNATKHTLDDLRTKQASNKKLLKESVRALEHAQTNLRSTRDTLESQERRVENAKRLSGVGLGLSLIPIVGWVVGPALVIGSAVEMAQASNAIGIAEEELKKFKNQEDKYKDKVCDQQSEIFMTMFNIYKIDRRLTQIREDIHMVRKQRRQVAELQRKMRSAVHLLSGLSGKVNVLGQQTRGFILHEAVMKVMEEVMKSTEEITGNELLCSKGMLRLVNKMRENNKHLRAICASQSDDEDESFLLIFV